MPIYLYKCKKCGLEFDVQQSINAASFSRHNEALPNVECNGDVFRKITRGTNVILKGTGFYETDYVRKPESASSSKSNTNSENTTTNK